jgi:hypothetical protein
MTWARELIGKPWESGARGPDAFDCYGLVHWVYERVLGVSLPPLAGLEAKDVLEVARAFKAESSTWRQTPEPTPLCVVAMSKNTQVHHVGLWLPLDRGVVLHSMEHSCVIAQTLSSLRSSGFKLIQFYQRL